MMNYHMGQGDVWDNDALIPIRKVTFIERLYMRLSFVFYIPRVIIRFLKIKQDHSVLHDGVRKLSGKKIAATSTDILFKDIKLASKAKRITINDLVTSCAATGLKQYFNLKGD